MENKKSQLNKEQAEAVNHQAGPLLIVAGAGTGKTKVISERIVNIINSGLAKSDEILALTFTDKAAGEMEERVDKLLPLGFYDLQINTFHSFCDGILRESGLDIGLPTDYKLFNTYQQYSLFRKNLDNFKLDYYRPLGNPTKFIRDLLSHFSRAKDEDITPDEYLKYATDLRQNLVEILKSKTIKNPVIASEAKQSGGASENKIPEFFKNAEGDFDEEVAEQEVKRIEEIASSYNLYQQILLDKGALDFGDLINYCLKLFRDRPNILEKYRAKFKYVLVDEFQDTNWSQYELVKMLAAPQNNITVVGDDDQCLPGDSLVLTRGGKKKIAEIKIGEEVATAVGKGFLSYSRVAFVNKNKKPAKLLTFKTISGQKITVTDNHKMFCFIPPNWFFHKKNKKEKRFFYVYLMHKQELGWRLGFTSDLAVRLKLERSADKIVAVRAFKTEEEARYHEVLWSLKYGLPTVCFAERDGIMTKHKWSEKLYKDLEIEKSVNKMAVDLNIDLNAHQVCLAGVVRGKKVRIKIVLEMCHRNYGPKNPQRIFLQTPQVLHFLSLETSHLPTIKILEKNGFKMMPAKKGRRLRISSADLAQLGKIALKIKELTGGIIENKIAAASVGANSKKALIIPAKNVLPGMFMPVVSASGVFYEQIISREEQEKNLIVYDLEIDKTHNFVADNFLVHNSIYRFRGAAMANILEFKKDYPRSKQVFLVENYRSGKKILDTAYDFIKLNNPNRLEAQLKSEGEDLSKELKANIEEPGIVEVIRGADTFDELAQVVKKIADLKAENKSIVWGDFAILARANDSAKEICSYLDEVGFPYKLNSSRGLYYKEAILNSINYLAALADHYDGVALYKSLSIPVFGFSADELASLNYLANRKAISLYKVLNEAGSLGLGEGQVGKINKFLEVFKKISADAGQRPVSEIFLSFLEDSGYLKFLYSQSEKQSVEAANLLNQLMKRIKDFEKESLNKNIQAFMEDLNMELEAGEQGTLPADEGEDPETIKIMTVHGSKGLEFKYVFVINLIDQRFPSREKGETIKIPDALLDEKLPEGEHHLEEERRLFYVAITRAKLGLWLAWSLDAGGKRERKPSRFLLETGLVKEKSKENKEESDLADELGARKNLLNSQKKIDKKNKDEKFIPKAPDHFSYSQFAAYDNCPYQYRFGNILKVPVRGKPSFSFGKTMHATLQKILTVIMQGEEKITLADCLKFYEESWDDDWYPSEKIKKEYQKKGRRIITDFYEEHKDNWPKVLFLEKSFSLRMKVDGEGVTIAGKIDRIDETPDGKLKIIDYKTGNPKDKLEFDDKCQLLIYQQAAKELFHQEVGALTFRYLENGSEIEFLGKEKDFEKLDNKISEIIRLIRKGEFPAKPGMCKFCDFNGICEFRKL